MRSARLTGLLILCVAAWGGVVALVGPTFNFETRGTPEAWVLSENHLTLSLAPALAGVVGGLALLLAGRVALARLGAAVAAIGGIWFVLAPALERLWSPHSPGISGVIGVSSSATIRALESIGYVYGTGVVLALLGGFALGAPRLAARPAPVPAPAPARDPEPELVTAGAREPSEPADATDPEAAETRVGAPSRV